MWKNVKRGRPQMTIWHMCVERWIPKATKTHSEYAMLIAFPLQRWLHGVPECYVTLTLTVLFRSVTGFYTNVLFCVCDLKKFEAYGSFLLNNGLPLQERTLGLIVRYRINVFVSKLCNDM
jgi:hypothetical protein